MRFNQCINSISAPVLLQYRPIYRLVSRGTHIDYVKIAPLQIERLDLGRHVQNSGDTISCRQPLRGSSFSDLFLVIDSVLKSGSITLCPINYTSVVGCIIGLYVAGIQVYIMVRIINFRRPWITFSLCSLTNT